MDVLPRLSRVVQVCGLVVVLISLALLVVVTPARADVGVRPILPGGSSIQPDEETPIQMAAEVVVMNVRSATEADNALIQLNPEAYGLQFQPVWFSAIAEVNADFTMKNPISNTVRMTVWFPLASALENAAWDELNPDEIVPRIESFKVALDGKPVSYTVSELPNPKGADRPKLPWASFPVTFLAGKESLIHVSYLLPLSKAIRGNELALYYVFQTGAGWAGQIGQAELFLNLPYPASMDTVAGMPSGSLRIPYHMADAPASLPPGGVFEGNQARWMWRNFEPGPEDDFAIWLIDPGNWQALENARGVVTANPQDGQAWLDLASICRSLSMRGYNQASIFSLSYLPSGIEAYRQAAVLLPEHPAPHTGLALLSLVPYMTEMNAPPEVIQTVQEEVQLARTLEDKNPSLAEEAGISSGMVEEILYTYFYDNATATAEWVAWSTEWANKTAVVLLLTPSTTPPHKITETTMPIPSNTLEPSPTPTSIQASRLTGNIQSLVIIVVAVIIGLVIVGYLVLVNMRGGASR